MKEELSSSEMSVLTRATRRNIPEVTILHSHRRENLKSYIEVLFAARGELHRQNDSHGEFCGYSADVGSGSYRNRGVLSTDTDDTDIFL
jgi:hypothetical protein